MKKILLLIPFFLLFSCSNFGKKIDNFNKAIFSKKNETPEVSEEFVQGSEDIPLLVGMEKISEGALGFDSAEGSIIASSYLTNLPKIEVKNFYVQTLPQMGWRLTTFAEGVINFERDKEDLEIELSQEEGRQIVRFFISSQTAGF